MNKQTIEVPGVGGRKSWPAIIHKMHGSGLLAVTQIREGSLKYPATVTHIPTGAAVMKFRNIKAATAALKLLGSTPELLEIWKGTNPKEVAKALETQYPGFGRALGVLARGNPASFAVMDCPGCAPWLIGKAALS